MRTLKCLPIAAVLVAALIFGGSAASAAPAASAVPSAPQSGNCHYQFVPPNSWVLECDNGNGGPGGGGGGGGGGNNYACTTTLLTQSQIDFLGLPPPPKGEKWAAIQCPGPNPFGGVTLVSTATGAPAVTPQELLQVAIGELQVPVLPPATAPPIGKDGLVGLPEWFWVPSAQWQPVTVTVAAGPVWAEVIATPDQLAFDPGGGLAPVTCPGPGISYAAARKANKLTTVCKYPYQQSSALQPGGAYQASVTVTWKVTWTGSGGVGGVVNAGLPIADPISVRVAEGQALVTGTETGQ